ncbi:bestrophin-4 isoform X1 [Anopheles stephensi]|uniref:bestrophin-4 isoform X1 n=1 Tax=Anopheles stephensi TaxID=30069 RepID=UPI0007D59CD9|nr:bestrophin-4 isoform X1 [Anopheles stephensi]XP_035898408.1 bestrophin-4 isoform X1 [Anopheles stephensi]XP_035898409.1 bestrophin-4 isoform X1 [Anopheles stephensi]XP_035898410.1 bestrophin-4 isoform X1 [Anopheles stephensi]XP_035898411.1 bestrophin-4 isoform X1 [Anopheles stephensi]
MTVTYTAEVATCRGFGCFLKLLVRWRGSIYKLVWLDLTCFLLLYYVLNITYRFGLSEDQKRIFEEIVKYCATYSNLIPLSFVLGFYVTIVMTRWWNQYTSIPWPDPIAVFVSANIHGQDERGRVMRRTIMRYVCLCLTMVLTNISPRVKKRFPTIEHLVEAGLLNENEHTIMSHLNQKFPRHSKHWLPIVWAASIVTRARKEGRCRDDFASKTIIDELNKFRGQCGLLISYDTISVPLVYTQVVTLAVYSYFLTSVMGQQWVETKELGEGVVNKIDQYFPIFTTLQFFFYMGWLKVAESLINPFGEDDDDFEVNWMVDRNLQVSYLIVDEMHHEHPELLKDQYWDEIFPTELPHTVASAEIREEPPQPSTADIVVKKREAEVIPVVPTAVRIDEMVGKQNQAVEYNFPANPNDDEMDDNVSGIHFNTSEKPIYRGGSSATSLASVAGTISRVNTVASALKRFFSKDESSRPNSATPDAAGTVPFKFPGSASSNNLAGGRIPDRAMGSMRITDQVIEEVDEQLTITSMQGNNDSRPTAASLFEHGPPKPSEPVDVPQQSYNRTQSSVAHGFHSQLTPPGPDTLLSASAPETGRFEHNYVPLSPTDPDAVPMVASSTALRSMVDETDRVTTTFDSEETEKEQLERKTRLLARSISKQAVLGLIDTEMLLDELTKSTSDLEGSEHKKPPQNTPDGPTSDTNSNVDTTL